MDKPFLKRKPWHNVKQRNIEAIFDCLILWGKNNLLSANCSSLRSHAEQQSFRDYSFAKQKFFWQPAFSFQEKAERKTCFASLAFGESLGKKGLYG